jgi:hypothetical protein
MRNIGIALGAIATAVLFGSLPPIFWSAPPHLPVLMVSISPNELTLAGASPPVTEQVDPF